MLSTRLVTVLLALGLLPSLAQAAPPAIDANVRFYGRWDRRQPDRAITVNGGSYIVARFDGRAISARFDVSRNKPPMPTVAWRVDDDIEWRESEIAASLELEKDLKPGEHTIQLLVRGLDEHQPRWSEPLTASLTFLGFDLPGGGKLLEPPAEPKLKIEFLGDSITEGVRVHDKQPGRDTWTWLTDGLRAWPAQTAMKLNAQWRQVGFGRLGITIPGNGGVPVAPDSFDWFYAGCPRDDWQPDVVVINQGTNDRNATSDQFRPGYRRYLEVIRKAYPNANILALRPFNGAHAEDIKAEVDARVAAGDEKVGFVDTTGWVDAATDYTDKVHPNAGAGPKIADKLAAVIENRAGGK